MNWGQYNTRHVIKHVTLKFNRNHLGKFVHLKSNIFNYNFEFDKSRNNH